MPNSRPFNRRRFIQGATAAGASGLFHGSAQVALGQESPNDRPTFATIGLRNQGWTITSKSFKFADFAAMADVDTNVLGANVEKAKNVLKEMFHLSEKVLDDSFFKTFMRNFEPIF